MERLWERVLFAIKFPNVFDKGELNAWKKWRVVTYMYIVFTRPILSRIGAWTGRTSRRWTRIRHRRRFYFAFSQETARQFAISFEHNELEIWTIYIARRGRFLKSLRNRQLLLRNRKQGNWYLTRNQEESQLRAEGSFFPLTSRRRESPRYCVWLFNVSPNVTSAHRVRSCMGTSSFIGETRLSRNYDSNRTDENVRFPSFGISLLPFLCNGTNNGGFHQLQFEDIRAAAFIITYIWSHLLVKLFRFSCDYF